MPKNSLHAPSSVYTNAAPEVLVGQVDDIDGDFQSRTVAVVLPRKMLDVALRLISGRQKLAGARRYPSALR